MTIEYSKDGRKLIKAHGVEGHLVIPDTVTVIGASAFAGCSDLASVAIPNSVTMIDEAAFLSCDSLTSIKLPSSVTTIRDGAFCDCKRLTEIDIPHSVTEISGNPVMGCEQLRDISMDEANSSFKCEEGVVFSEDGRRLLFAAPGWDFGTYTIPDSVRKIATGAFDSCKGLTAIVIPQTVSEIGLSAFCDCTNLRTVHCKIEHTQDIDNMLDTFTRCNLENCTLLVPEGTEEAYRHHPEFSRFEKIMPGC